VLLGQDSPEGGHKECGRLRQQQAGGVVMTERVSAIVSVEIPENVVR